jgi:hypothetical protein
MLSILKSINFFYADVEKIIQPSKFKIQNSTLTPYSTIFKQSTQREFFKNYFQLLKSS